MTKKYYDKLERDMRKLRLDVDSLSHRFSLPEIEIDLFPQTRWNLLTLEEAKTLFMGKKKK